MGSSTVTLSSDQVQSLISHLKLIENEDKLAADQCDLRKKFAAPCSDDDVAYRNTEQAQITSLLKDLASQNVDIETMKKAKDVIYTHQHRLETQVAGCGPSTFGRCSELGKALDTASIAQDSELLAMINGQLPPVQSQPVAHKD
jgi:hypothetical protein